MTQATELNPEPGGETTTPSFAAPAQSGSLGVEGWRPMVDRLDEAVIACSGDGTIVYANEAVEKLLGWHPGDLFARPLTEVMPERFRARHLAGFERFTATGTGRVVGRPIRLPALRKDGTEVGVEMVISGVGPSAEVAVVGLLRGVGDRIELEGPGDLSDRLVATMAETSTLEEAWPRVLEALVGALGWDVAQLWLADASTTTLERRSAWAAPGSTFGAFIEASARTFRRGGGLPGSVWERLGPQWLPDLSDGLEFPRAEAAGQSGLRSGFAFPLIAGHRFVGVIELFSVHRRDPNPYLTSHLRNLGRELGSFLEQRLSEEHRWALSTTLQQSLLPPRLPEIPGARLAARYLPATTGSEVGGDFYDVFRIARGSWGLVIGDVCGKGAEAAAVTALARYTVRAAAVATASPARALGVLNTELLRQAADGGPDRFVTAVLARARRSAAGLDVTLAAGGHPLPYLRRASGTVETVGAPGTLLGVLDHVQIADTTVRLGPGDVLVMVTDGVLEARRDGEQFGEEGLHALLGATHGADVQATVDAIANTVMAYQHSQPADDIAILAIAADT